jgi:hypothetical protein
MTALGHSGRIDNRAARGMSASPPIALNFGTAAKWRIVPVRDIAWQFQR